MSRERKRRKPKPVERHGGLRLTEEALHLLRGAGLRAWTWYLVGSVPFWLGLVWYVTLMFESGLAASRVVSGALPMAPLYGWMKCCQSRFAIELWRSAGKPVELTSGWRRRLVFRQCFWQPYGLLLVPLSHLFLVPYPFVSSFFQNLTVCEALGETKERPVRQKAADYGSKEILKSVTFLFLGKKTLFLLVGLNWLTVLGVAPHLAYSLTGIENEFVRNPAAYLGGGFWMTVWMFTFLTVDPLLKAYHLLRCSAIASRKTGGDLRDELRGLRHAAAGLAVCLWLGALPGTGPGRAIAESTVRPAELDGVIDQVSRQEKYLWRMPPELFEESREALNPFQRFLRSLAEDLGDAVEAGFETLLEWWKTIFGKWEPDLDPGDPAGFLDGLQSVAKGLMILLIVALAAMVSLLVFRAWRRRRPTARPAEGGGVEAPPDLEDEEVMANALPVDKWLSLARDLQAGGEWRLALRALFLAFLARLEERRLLVIRRSKSNRDYERELESRGLPEPELLPFFQRFRREFEAVWYGDYPATSEQVDDLRDWLEQWGESA